MCRRPASASLDRANQPANGREVPGFILGAEVGAHDAGVHIVCSDARPGKLSGELLGHRQDASAASLMQFGGSIHLNPQRCRARLIPCTAIRSRTIAVKTVSAMYALDCHNL